MCQLMSGYQSFLRPIKSAPSCAKATDTGNLFDLGGFFRSRDKSGTEFFKRLLFSFNFNDHFLDFAKHNRLCGLLKSAVLYQIKTRTMHFLMIVLKKYYCQVI